MMAVTDNYGADDDYNEKRNDEGKLLMKMMDHNGECQHAFIFLAECATRILM